MLKKRRVISKEERILIANRFGFRCGYCGVGLGKKFHIDHVVAFIENQNCDTSNLLASCIPCNLFKSCLSLEQFRREIGKQSERAFKTSVNFRTAYRFKQIKITLSPIIFYFETLGIKYD